MRFILLTFLLMLSLLARAQTSGWRDQSGNSIPDSDAMKAKAGFAASLLVTTDHDWREKWDTPAQTIPNFHRAQDISYGKRVFVLLFFANPQPGVDGQVKIACDVQIQSPLGKVSFEQKNMTCFAGRIAGSLTNTYLSAPVIAFSADPGDPAGNWVVKASLRDEIRQVELPLTSSFKLRP